MSFQSTKIIELGSCAFRQPNATSHCRYIHGYRLSAKFWFSADELDENNWVVDFGGLKGLKKLMQDQFDYTTCISRTDPKLDVFKKLSEAGVCDLRIMDGVGIEKFAEYCHTVADNYVDELTDGRCNCTKVEVFEHENNSAIYECSEPSEEEKSVNQMKRSKTPESVVLKEVADTVNESAVSMDQDHGSEVQNVSINTTKPVSKEKEKKADLTQPPFAKRVSQPSLWPKKETNKWLDSSGNSTWGF